MATSCMIFDQNIAVLELQNTQAAVNLTRALLNSTPIPTLPRHPATLHQE